MDKFKRKIQEQAKSTQGTRTDLTSSPNGEKVISTHTDKELAKMAGVGVGTVARYDAIMKTDDYSDWTIGLKQLLLPVGRIKQFLSRYVWIILFHFISRLSLSVISKETALKIKLKDIRGKFHRLNIKS